MSTPTTDSPYSRKNPFPARLLVNRILSKPGSNKEIRHFEVSLEGSGLSYEVGNAMGIYPTNDPALVEELIATIGATGDELVPNGQGKEVPFREALLANYHITQGSKQCRNTPTGWNTSISC